MTTRIARGIGALVVGAGRMASVASRSSRRAQQPAARRSSNRAAAAAPQQAASAPAPGWNKPPAWNDVSDRGRNTPRCPAARPTSSSRARAASGASSATARSRSTAAWHPAASRSRSWSLFYLAKGPIKTARPAHGPAHRALQRASSAWRTGRWGYRFVRAGAHRHRDPLRQVHHPADRWGTRRSRGSRSLAKNLHNFVGPLFIFASGDLHHALRPRQLLSSPTTAAVARQVRRHALGRARALGQASTPARRRSSGCWWSGSGSVISVTGLILNFPNWNQGREAMQLANLIHGDLRDPRHGDGLLPHLPGHHRHAGRATRDEDGLRRRDVGARAPPALVRRSEGRASGPRRSSRARAQPATGD